MRLVASAYKGKNEHLDTFRTGELIAFVGRLGLKSRLVVGSFRNKKEMAVEVTGFTCEEVLVDTARRLAEMFEQECVYMSLQCKAYLITKQGKTTSLGIELVMTGGMPELIALHGYKPEGYTELLSGGFITSVRTSAALAA